jgi:hypothetical protein
MPRMILPLESHDYSGGHAARGVHFLRSFFAVATLQEYRDGYNSAVIEHIDRQHGAGTFERARAEVERFRRESYDRTA